LQQRMERIDTIVAELDLDHAPTDGRCSDGQLA
jgi:hypothetical protein